MSPPKSDLDFRSDTPFPKRKRSTAAAAPGHGRPLLVAYVWGLRLSGVVACLAVASWAGAAAVLAKASVPVALLAVLVGFLAGVIAGLPFLVAGELLDVFLALEVRLAGIENRLSSGVPVHPKKAGEGQ